MPIRINADLPAKKILEHENIFVMDYERSLRQDIRPLKIIIMNLMPTKLEAATIYKRVDDLKKYSVMTCMECGCCAFVCPANRKLVQSMRIGKAILRNAGK